MFDDYRRQHWALTISARPILVSLALLCTWQSELLWAHEWEASGQCRRVRQPSAEVNDGAADRPWSFSRLLHHRQPIKHMRWISGRSA